MIRTINVFSPGDSRNITLWSNVPYMLCRALERCGYRVNRIDYHDNAFRRRKWLKPLVRLCDVIRLVGINFSVYTWVYYRSADCKIARAAREFQADLNITTSFDMCNRFTDKPNVVIGDWTQEYLYRRRLHRRVKGHDRVRILRQKQAIERSDYVVSLFPQCAEDMRAHYDNPRIFHLGCNAVNSVYDGEIDPEAVSGTKAASRKILFVGRKRYLRAARLLVESFTDLLSVQPDAELHIVGLSASDLHVPPPATACVHFHGYLNKADPAQRELYYRLMLEARVFTNPSPLWGGYSSTIEAMYFCNPVVISPYEDFTSEFGAANSFAFYCPEFTREGLTAILAGIFSEPEEEYTARCRAARAAVEEYTWENWVRRLIALVEKG